MSGTELLAGCYGRPISEAPTLAGFQIFTASACSKCSQAPAFLFKNTVSFSQYLVCFLRVFLKLLFESPYLYWGFIMKSHLKSSYSCIIPKTFDFQPLTFLLFCAKCTFMCDLECLCMLVSGERTRDNPETGVFALTDVGCWAVVEKGFLSFK